MQKIVSKLIVLSLICVLSSCSGIGVGTAFDMQGDTLTTNARLLTLVRYDTLCTVAVISDPWNEGAELSRLVLVPRGKKRPDHLPEGTIVEVPLQNSVVYSIVHQEAISEIGALDGIGAVADSEYITDNHIVERMQRGRIRAVGSAHAPKLDVISKLQPDAILVSPYNNGMHKVVYDLGVPVVECADYMESSPLARAEWILLLGELYAQRDRAMEIYATETGKYKALADSVKVHMLGEDDILPRVMTEMTASGVWYMPGGRSYMARMLADAGGDYVWADNDDTGSLELDAPTVLNRAQSADVWLIRTNNGDVSEQMLRDNCTLNVRFKAFIEGNVYGCNTSVNNIYNVVAFHPERVLRDYVLILHPDMFPGEQTRYFKRMKR